MGAFIPALNSLFILAQAVVGIFGIVIRRFAINLIVLQKSCTPESVITIEIRSAIWRVFRLLLRYHASIRLRIPAGVHAEAMPYATIRLTGIMQVDNSLWASSTLPASRSPHCFFIFIYIPDMVYSVWLLGRFTTNETVGFPKRRRRKGAGRSTRTPLSNKVSTVLISTSGFSMMFTLLIL